MADVPGKIETKSRPYSLLAVNVDESIILLNDTMHHGEAEARSFADPFMGEKRFENFIDKFFFHTASIVADSEQHVLVRAVSCMVRGKSLVKDAFSVSTVIFPAPLIASLAFVHKLVSICPIWIGSI
jgi:hypothetical protein